jgi:hypothetical protein
MSKKFEGKTTQLIAVDSILWKEFNTLRQPYGTINEMFEDWIRFLLGYQVKHPELVNRIKEVLATGLKGEV